MKRNILITVLIILTSFSTQSQTRQDSTVIANKDAKALLSAFDEWKTLKPENKLLYERVDLLEKRVSVKDSIYDKCRDIQIKLYKSIDLYKAGELNLIAQRSNLEKDIKKLTKTVKRQKSKTFITSLAGVAGMVALFLLK